MTTTHVLTLTLTDRPGIVHQVTTALLGVGANIIESAQFSDPDTNTFCMRTVVVTDSDNPKEIQQAVTTGIGETDVSVKVRRQADRPRTMILVSKFDHCLVDLLYRWKNDQLPIDVPLIVSNHPDCQQVAAHYGVPYIHLPVSKDADGPNSKVEQEAQIRRLMVEYRIDLVVLARYMQILSNEFCDHLSGRAINIHHSFLPGFKGAKPYHQAYTRGVKLVGATAHFVTAHLDEGPIIEQEVARVSHAHSATELVALGQDTERRVLAKAVRDWAEDRILIVGQKTVVFP